MSLRCEEYTIGSLVELTEVELRQIISSSGAVLKEDHYQLVSGNHTNCFFDLNRIANNPKLVSRLSSEFIKWIEANINNGDIQVVLSPVTGGRILAFDIVRAFNGRMETRLAHAPVDLEKNPGKVLPDLTPPSRIYRDENVLIVTDLITTGGGLNNLEKIVRDHDAKLLGILAVATRSDDARAKLNEIAKRHGVKSHVLINFNWEHHSPEECDLCKQGVPLVKPAGGLSNFSPIIFGLKTENSAA